MTMRPRLQTETKLLGHDRRSSAVAVGAVARRAHRGGRCVVALELLDLAVAATLVHEQRRRRGLLLGGAFAEQAAALAAAPRLLRFLGAVRDQPLFEAQGPLSGLLLFTGATLFGDALDALECQLILARLFLETLSLFVLDRLFGQELFVLGLPFYDGALDLLAGNVLRNQNEVVGKRIDDA